MLRNRVRSLSLVWIAITVSASFSAAATKSGTVPPNPKVVARVVPTSSGRAQVKIDGNSANGALTAELPDPKVAMPNTVVAPLSPSATASLLKRLEPLPDFSEQNKKAPTMRAPTAAPPRAGGTQAIPFMVPTGKAVADAPVVPVKAMRPLVPPQITPEGEVKLESEVRIRFDEAMVAVAAVGNVGKPPATITPAVTGTWRWIDSRVLTFKVSNARFPAASEFVVTVPAGTKALSGAMLATEVKTRFATRPVKIDGVYPSGVIRPDSPIVVLFDQAIDTDRILPFLRVENEKGKPLQWKKTTLSIAQRLWEKNPSIQFDPTAAGRIFGLNYVVLAPATAWPAGRPVQTVLKDGAPSKEGPRVSTRETFAHFKIAPPFTVKGVMCAEMSKPRMTGAICPAWGWLGVEFSNVIEPHSYRSSKVQIEGVKFDDHPSYGTTTSLLAPKVVGREYKIAIGNGLVDVYGQPLVSDRQVSFTTGPRRFNSFVHASTGLRVLDPRFEVPQWVVKTEAVTSLRVQLFRVKPTDYFAYEDYEAGRRTSPPGTRVSDKQYPIGVRGGANIRVDLRPALDKNGVGHVIAIATSFPSGKRRQDVFEINARAWIQVTKLGISARLDKEKVSGWIHAITPSNLLAPIAGVTASLLVKGLPEVGISAVSDQDGHVAFDLASPKKREKHVERDRSKTTLLLAQTGGDTTFTAIDSFEKAIRNENALWYVTDDRFIYKPDEKVYLKGWVRWTHDGVNPDITLPTAGQSVAYTLNDSRGNKITTGTARLSEQGGFDIEVKLPQNIHLGHASFDLTLKDVKHSHPISIEEFRTPAYSMTLNDDVSHAGATPLILGESIEMNASAKYYAGGGLGGAAIQWDAKLAASTYQPPGWDLFSFNPPSAGEFHVREYPVVPAHKQGTLTSASTASVVFGIPALPGNRPSLLDVDATVTDLDRMSIRASSRSILVHPSAYYVGMRLQGGKDDVIEVVVTDIDGNTVRDVPMSVRIEGVLGSERYLNNAKVLETQMCKLKSGALPVTCTFKRADYKIAYSATATVADARSRTNVARYDVPWYSVADTERDLEIVPDKALYHVGDTAKLEIRSTVLPATAVVSFVRQGVIAQKRIELTKKSTCVELPIEPGYVQNVFVVGVSRKKTTQPSG